MNEPLNERYFAPEAFAELASFEGGNWWFCSRNELILWTLRKYVGNFQRFLEVGCGTGFVLDAVRRSYENADLYGTEYFEEGLIYARKRVPTANFRQLDATAMNEIESFDVVGAFDVLEHIEEDEKVIRNLFNAIKSGGALIVTVPQHRWLWSAVDEYARHVRRYTREEFLAKMKQAGLEIQYVTSFASLLVPFMWLSRLRAKNGTVDPMSEFKIPRWLNSSLYGVMRLEKFLLLMGVRFPFGGSLLVVARKPLRCR